MSLYEFKTQHIFCMIWHICNRKHSISKYIKVLICSNDLLILALSSTTPWPGLATDVTCLTSLDLSLPPPTSHIITTSWTPLPPQHMMSFMDDPCHKTSLPQSLK